MDGQEVELSIQETNRLREQLGLKPLAIEEENENNQGTYRNPRWVQDESTEEHDNLKSKLERQRHKRLQRSVFDAKPLGLDLEEELETQLDTLQWVEKSRNLERQRKTRKGDVTTNKASNLLNTRQQPSTNGKVEEKLDYIPDFVVGATEEDLRGSEEMILTLKDRNVLDEEEDELENIQLRERQQSLLNQRMKRAINKRNTRGATFEEEFPEMEDFSTEKTHSLLPKYDELDLYNDKNNRFRLSSLTEKERQAVCRERVENLKQQFSTRRKEESASLPETRIQGEYFTPKEFLGFGKLKRTSGKKKKNKSRRLVTAEDDLEGGAKSEAAVDEIAQFNIEPEERLKRLHELRFQGTSDGKTPNAPSTFEISDHPDNKHQESSGWRRVRFLRERGAERVLSAIQESGNFESRKNDSEEGNETLVLDDLTEFVYNLDPHSFSREGTASTKASSPLSSFAEVSRRDEIASHHDEEEGNISMSSGHLSGENQDTMSNDLDGNEDERKDDLEADLVSIGLEEEPVSMGVAAALKHLQMTGNLHQEFDQVGRTKDERIADARQWEEGSKRIKLEYVDEFGRELTPKEAFRQLSYKFHGKGPGKAKQEKRLRKYIQELRSKMLSNGDDTPLHSVRHLKDETKQSAVPYIVLQSSTLSKEMNSGEHSRSRSTSTWERTDIRKPQSRKKQSISATSSSPSNVSFKTNEEAKEAGNASHVVAVAIPSEGSRSMELAQSERGKIAIQLGRNTKRKRPVLNKQSFE
ncbi:hypothetical protein GpartN1_g3763.t1 [Galdieria partita]|uniref:U4/U6.U5 tri-snRNP-associated protein 1 n=1 Tax=Galdieria partita TaxID=83374 RepID=A0A9C7PY24_9RHOD|nr:hypothetical protein GpartN1_g3763.t1 [Galdieria partita]